MLTTSSLLPAMLKAVEPLLSDRWPQIRPYAEGEAAKLAQTLVTVASLRNTRQIDDDQATALIDMQRHFAQAMFLTVEGVGLATAQHSVDALLGAVKDRFNRAVSLSIL
jgi:hypothetical protein